MENSWFPYLHSFFRKGYSYLEMKLLLQENHGVFVSVRHLRRIANSIGLYKRKESNIERCSDFIQSILSKTSGSHGYRLVHQQCIKDDFVISMENVRLILKVLDSQGVALRRRRQLTRREYISRGPNYIWHIDGYDKLKPFGIAIHGCIDGYSRNIIWLKAGITNNDPKVIAGYYIEALIELRGCPKSTRSDFGTENRYVEQMQRFFHRNSMQSDKCHIYGSSTHNQRIESLWAIFRRQCAEFWIQLFKWLKHDNLFNGSLLDKNLIQFCFMELIQKDIQAFLSDWNHHKIRHNASTAAPSGRPHILHTFPELLDAEDYIHKVDEDEVDVCLDECSFNNHVCDEDMYDLCNILIEEMGWIRNDDPYSTVDLYMALRNCISRELR